MKFKLSKALTLAVTAGMFASSVPVYAASELTMDKISGYDCGEQDAEGGVMEIIAYNKVNGYVYAVNGKSGHRPHRGRTAGARGQRDADNCCHCRAYYGKESHFAGTVLKAFPCAVKGDDAIGKYL